MKLFLIYEFKNIFRDKFKNKLLEISLEQIM